MRTWFAVLAFPVAVAQAAPMQFTQMGRMLDASGSPIEGSHQLVVRLYDGPSAEEAAWTRSYPLVFENGYYTVSLSGSGTEGLDLASLWSDSQAPEVYMTLAVDEGSQTVPQRVAAVPQAASAEVARAVPTVEGDATCTVVGALGYRVGSGLCSCDGSTWTLVSGGSCDADSGGQPFEGMEINRVSFGSAVQYVSLAAFGDGRLGVLYRDAGDVGAFGVFSETGEAIAGPIAVPGFSFSAATALSSGNVAVAFSDFNDGQAGKLMVFDSAGNEVLEATSFAPYANHFGLAELGDGSVMASYQGIIGPSILPAFAQIDPATGEVLHSGSLELGTDDVGSMDAVALPSGEVLVAFTQQGGRFGDDGLLRAAIVGLNGSVSPVTATGESSGVVARGVDADGGGYALDIASFASGKMGIFYNSNENGRFAIVTPSGSVEARDLSFHDGVYPISITATQVGGGGALVAYRQAGTGNTTTYRLITDEAWSVGPSNDFLPEFFMSGQAESVQLTGGTVVLGYNKTPNGSASAGELLFLE